MGGGRPKKLFTDAQLKEVEQLAAQGLSQKQIAAYFGVNEKTVMERKRDQKEFREYLERGRSKGIAAMTNALFKTGMAGNVTAQQFYLKNRAGWSDKQEHEVTGKGGGPVSIDWSVESVSVSAKDES